MDYENPVIFIEMDYGIRERTGRLRSGKRQQEDEVMNECSWRPSVRIHLRQDCGLVARESETTACNVLEALSRMWGNEGMKENWLVEYSNAAAVPLHGHRTAHTANGIGIDKFVSTTAVEWMICSVQRDLRICPPEAGISALSSDTGNPLNAYRRWGWWVRSLSCT